MAARPVRVLPRQRACLFYADVARLEDRWADERTSRVWIQGDLHAENYGTYMDSEGVLVFDVNDFDEAYLGPLHAGTSGGWRRASRCWASPRRSPTTPSGEMIDDLRGAPTSSRSRAFAGGDRDEEFRLTLRQHRGRVHDVLAAARLETPARTCSRRLTRDRRATTAASARASGVRRLDDDERDRGARGLRALPRHDPRRASASTSALLRGQGRGRARRLRHRQRRPARLQPAHRGPHAGARERRRALDEAGQRRRAEPRRRRRARSRGYFEHQGHRTAVSQRALQAHADPWLGWCELGGVGQVVAELSPYEADLDWDAVTDLDEILPLLRYLGQATAKVHCVSDAGSDQALVDVPDRGGDHGGGRRRGEAFADRPGGVRRRPTARSRATTTGASSTRSATARSRACRRHQWPPPEIRHASRGR